MKTFYLDENQSAEGKNLDLIQPRGHIAVTEENWYDIYQDMLLKYPNAWKEMNGVSPTPSSPEKASSEFRIWRLRQQFHTHGFKCPSYKFIQILVDLGL